MDKLVESGEKFGVVVLDPPRFARNRNDVKDALRGYRRLHMQGIKLVEDGGFLVSCCCSGAINMDMMEELLAQVATDQKRDIQVIEKRGPSGDHPVSVSCLESHYLKCLITRVL
jgi:23S rRNA (cytosine1962-C5)-methyltransferase